MKFDLQRTIVAVSSGVMAGRRAIVRLSGGLTPDILRQVMPNCEDHSLLDTSVPRAAKVTCAFAFHGRDGLCPLPAYVYYWPDSRSFTGEVCAEIHLLGSMPIVEAFVAHLCTFNAQPAERGEFTLRSFLAGKIDLVQAEAVLGVIEAEGPIQLQQALARLGGNLSKPVRAMRDQLIELIAHLEAGLDFVEEDIEFISAHELVFQLTGIVNRIKDLLDQLHTREARSRTAQVVLVGLPNSGKSSLFNRLTGMERTIVSPMAGTTRDLISQTIELSGVGVELVDTAGIEELADTSPRAKAQLALNQRLKTADIALFCIDTSQPLDENWRAAQVQSFVQAGVSVLTVGTKSELMMAANQGCSNFDALVSACEGTGIDELRNSLSSLLARRDAEFQTSALQHIAIRCQQSLAAAAETLGRAIRLADSDAGEELVAMELRLALDDLASIIGEIHSDDILGEIFSRFCIGK